MFDGVFDGNHGLIPFDSHGLHLGGIAHSIGVIPLDNQGLHMGDPSHGGMAGEITASFTDLKKLTSAGAFLAALGYSIGEIMKFKEHHDHPPGP